MKKLIHIASTVCLLILFSFTMAQALPNLQVYIQGATPNSSGGDEDTWFFTPGSGGNVNFNVVISFGPKDVSVSDLTLLLSVKQIESGSITYGATTYTVPAPNLFLPAGIGTNHYPLNNEEEFDYFTIPLALGTLLKPENKALLPDYNADTGLITDASAYGYNIPLELIAGGFSYVHFDVYGDFNDSDEGWEINPGSHDSSVVPEPTTLLLLGSGLIGIGAFVRRRFRK